MRKRDLLLQLDGQDCNQEGGPPTHLSLSEISSIKEALSNNQCPSETLYQAMDLYVRQRVEPAQAMFTTWMSGAKAQVMGKDIPFSRVITWCQEQPEQEARRLLAKEIRSLCRFLAPFSHATWQAMLAAVGEDLGYRDYPTYCQAKRGKPLEDVARLARQFLDITSYRYHKLISPWLEAATGLSLDAAIRFDAIYLLGLRYLDQYFPRSDLKETIREYFSRSGIEIFNNSRLTIHAARTSGSQSFCMPIRIPRDIHIIIGPGLGWLDLEALFHELGHALSLIYTDEGLAPKYKDFYQSLALSESFAFLLQRLCMSRYFLTEVLGLKRAMAEMISQVHGAKLLILARRYAAKSIIEFENFSRGWIQRGQDLYARILKQETGFSYDPETYLFDLMPDFYAMDYFTAFLGASCMWEYLVAQLGENWVLDKKVFTILKDWWRNGNRYDLLDFLEKFCKGPLTPDAFMKGLPVDFPVDLIPT